MDIVWKLEEEDIEWLHKAWSYTDGTGKVHSFEDEMKFDQKNALALLLMNEVIFINDHWWEKEWPEAAQKICSLNVNCNDVFAWGCADAEELPYAELENLYRLWRKDPEWGPAIWCMLQRKEMPQKPLEDIIRKQGIWDLDSLKLDKNTTDAEVSAMFANLCKK